MAIQTKIRKSKLQRDMNKTIRNENYHRTEMHKELVLQRLKEQGCRITRQRQMLLDVILKEECTSCKEVYYRALELDPKIGASTVYRMVNLLEEIGAIGRRDIYKISGLMNGENDKACTIELDDNTVCQLSAKNWHTVILEGLKVCGYVEDQSIENVIMEY